jgi:hypothetical protein
VEEITHPDERVLAFNIPPRPAGTAFTYEGAYLMRVGESLVPMSEDMLRRIFAEGNPDFLLRYAPWSQRGRCGQASRYPKLF